MTLNEELQRIVAEDLLNKNCFICINLKYNYNEFQKFKEMASNYAKGYFYGGSFWWSMADAIYDNNYDYVISEKYRFIKDLIKLLDNEEKLNQ